MAPPPADLTPSPVIVDAHVHLLPERLQRRIREFFALHMPADLAYPTDHGAVLDSLARDGVDLVWSLPYAHRADVAAGMNEAMAGIVGSAVTVKVVGGATIHPGDADPLTVLRRAVEDLGLQVLKLHCSVGDYSPDDPRLDPVWEYVSAIRLPVVVHAGHAVSGHTEVDELLPLAATARRYPEARIIIAHCGHRAVDSALDMVASHPHVHADLTPVVTEPVALPAGRAEALSDRLLFGSDAPNTARRVAEDLDDLGRLGLSEQAVSRITGGNARRLLAGVLS